jgi:hypothetical protein
MPPMLVRAALLLLSLMCHLAAPFVAFAATPTGSAPLAISTEKGEPASSWTPRAADARDLVQPPERQGRPMLLPRTTGSHHVQAPTGSVGSWERGALPPPAYPSRRWLRRTLARHAADDSPA